MDTLFFCTREGVFFKAVYDALFNTEGNGNDAPGSDLIKVSRLSSFAPSLVNGESINFLQLFRLYKSQSPESLLLSMGQDPAEFEQLLKKHGVMESGRFYDESDNPNFIAFLEDDEFQELIGPDLARQKNAIKKYLEQHFGARKKVGFVEIGWRGTIQNAIASLFPDREFYGFYLGLALERIRPNPNCIKLAYGPNHNVSSADVDLLDAINVLEFVCLSNGGSAESYQVNPDESFTVTMRNEPAEDRWVESFSLPFQRGVLEIANQTHSAELYEEHLSGKLKTKALPKWRMLLRKPDSSLVKAYFSMKSNEQFGRGSISDQSQMPTFSTVMLSPFSRIRRKELVEFLTYSQWAEGMIRRTDIGFFARFGFYGLMRTALLFKKIMHRRLSTDTQSS